MKYYNKHRLITFIYLFILLMLVTASILIFNINNFYVRVILFVLFAFIFQKPYLRVLNTLETHTMEEFESSCLIEDIIDYHEFNGLRFKRIFTKNKKYRALYHFYLTSFYTLNEEFPHTSELLNFLSENPKFNISRIQVLNNEMLKEAINGDFEKVENLYIELCYAVDIEIEKQKEGSKRIEILDQVKMVLGKFVELTKNINEETISNARLWINKNINLYNAIDNYCIVKILEYHNDTEYIEEFKDNLREIKGDIVFLQLNE